MLLQFTVGNYRSFREKTTFSLVAEPQERGHENTLLDAQQAAGVNVLSLGVLYGANASGKSNLLKAIQTLQGLVANGVAPYKPVPVDRFLLGGSNFTDAEPTFLEVHFVAGKEIYCYGLECNARHIQREWLRVGKEETTLFDRYTDANGKVTIENYSQLAHRSETKPERIELIAEGTRENQPFLRQASDQRVLAAMGVSIWFSLSLQVILTQQSVEALFDGMIFDDASLEEMSTFLRNADTGIEQILLVKEDFNMTSLPQDIRSNFEAILTATPDLPLSLSIYGNQFNLLQDKQTGKIKRLYLQAVHKDSSQSGTVLNWEDESDGTQRLAELWRTIFRPIGPQVLLVDEIERSLHPELMRSLLEQWRRSPPPNCQLIFTTHNDNFLEDDLLRRDEVWFVSKDKTGASRMVSETQFKPVEGVTRQRAYLDGMYGGTPRIPSRGFYSVSRDSREADK